MHYYIVIIRKDCFVVIVLAALLVEQYLVKKYSITPFQPATVPRESVLPGHTKPPAGEAK